MTPSEKHQTNKTPWYTLLIEYFSEQEKSARTHTPCKYHGDDGAWVCLMLFFFSFIMSVLSFPQMFVRRRWFEVFVCVPILFHISRFVYPKATEKKLRMHVTAFRFIDKKKKERKHVAFGRQHASPRSISWSVWRFVWNAMRQHVCFA